MSEGHQKITAETKSERVADYETRLTRLLGEGYEIHSSNIGEYVEDPKKARFLRGFSQLSPDGHKGFFKAVDTTASSPKLREQLQRESEAMTIAAAIGVRVLHQYQPFAERDGIAGIHLEALDLEEGDVLTNNALIAAADERYATWAADTIFETSGREIPAHVDSSPLARTHGDPNPHTVQTIWEESLLRTFFDEDSQILASEARHELRHVLRTLQRELYQYLDGCVPDEGYFFLHNDTAPNNTFFDRKTKTALLLDYEHASRTHYRFVAQIMDYANFYSRCWPNPELQRGFLARLYARTTAEGLPERSLLLNATAVLGAMNLAKYGMNPDHPEHAMSVALLRSLKENLDFLQQLDRES